jgi:integrase
LSYLSRRNGSANWYYRESVPHDIRELLVRRDGSTPKEVWVSLGTPDLRIAKTKLPFVMAEQHRKWAELRKVAAPAGTIPSIAEMTETVVDFVHARFIEGHKANLRATLQAGADPSEEAGRRRSKIIQAELYPTPDDLADMEQVANALCREKQWDLGPGEGVRGERWNHLLAMVTKAVQHARGKIVDTLEGRPEQTNREAVIQHIGGGKRRPKAKPGETLLELFELYAKDCLRDGKRADTLDAERKIIGHLASFVGVDRSVSDIKRPDIRDFKRALSRVPHRWVTRKELAGLSLAEAADEWERLGGTGRAQRTIARELSAVSSLFGWLIENAYVDDENPTAGFRPRFDKKAAKYPPYTDTQLKALFGGPLFTLCDKTKPWLVGTHEVRDWRYWLPLCALYSGARAGEIAQLLCADVREEQDVWVFDFNEDGNEGKSLKTTSSRRIVPVHPALLALGLAEHVAAMTKAGHKQLFPDIQPGPRGDWSYRPSKFWQKYLKNIGMKSRGLGLHSFRHGFVDECRRNRISKEVVQALLGHSDGSMTTHYGSIPWGTLVERKEAIEALSYDRLHAQVAADEEVSQAA